MVIQSPDGLRPRPDRPQPNYTDAERRIGTRGLIVILGVIAGGVIGLLDGKGDTGIFVRDLGIGTAVGVGGGILVGRTPRRPVG